jgi:hypothetical protein
MTSLYLFLYLSELSIRIKFIALTIDHCDQREITFLQRLQRVPAPIVMIKSERNDSVSNVNLDGHPISRRKQRNTCLRGPCVLHRTSVEAPLIDTAKPAVNCHQVTETSAAVTGAGCSARRRDRLTDVAPNRERFIPLHAIRHRKDGGTRPQPFYQVGPYRQCTIARSPVNIDVLPDRA